MKGDRVSAAGRFTDFGTLLKYLRRQAGLTQRDLGLAVGYSEAQISRLEHNHRLPEFSILEARFIPALGLEEQSDLTQRLLILARQAHQESNAAATTEEIGFLEAIPTAQGKQVTRQEALEEIRASLASAKAVMLYGFAGVGKSTLGATVARETLASRPVMWHTVSSQDSTPLTTFIRRLALFLASLGQSEAALFLQPGNLPLPSQVDSLGTQMQAVKPLICLDEFHNMQRDPQALSAIENLVRRSDSSFLLISRERLDLPSTPVIALHGLHQAEARQMLESWRAQLPEESFSKLYDLTQGNPMLLRMATSSLLQDPSQAESFLDRLATQSEIASFMMNHALEGLSSPESYLLSLLSIFRQPVNLLDAALAERLNETKRVTDLQGAIRTLQRRHFLENAAEADLHPLLQEHLSAFLKTHPDLFRELHILAASWLVDSRASTLEALYHFVQAGDVEAIIDLLTESLLYFDSSGQGEAAADLIASLLEGRRHKSSLVQKHEVQLLSLRGQLMMSGRRAGEAEADLRRALALALRLQTEPEEGVELRLRLARCLLQRGKVPEADQLCDEADRLAASGSDSGLLAETAAVRCTVRLTQTRLDEAQEAALSALQLIEPLSHLEVQRAATVRMVAYNVLGIAAHIRRDIPAAIAYWRQAEESALLAGNLRTAFRCKSNIGALLFDQSELDEARQTYEGILEAVQAIGDTFNLGKILNSLGAIYHLQGRPAEALELLDRARNLKQLTGDLQGEATTDNQRALVLLATGKASEARRIVERLLKQTEQTGEMRWRASYLDTLGMTLLALREFVPARDTLLDALTLPGVSDDPQLETYLYNHLALAHAGQGDMTQAQSVLKKVHPEAESGTAAIESQLVEAVLISNSKPHEAQKRLQFLEQETQRRTLLLYSRAAHRLCEALDLGNSLADCCQLAVS